MQGRTGTLSLSLEKEKDSEPVKAQGWKDRCTRSKSELTLEHTPASSQHPGHSAATSWVSNWRATEISCWKLAAMPTRNTANHTGSQQASLEKTVFKRQFYMFSV